MSEENLYALSHDVKQMVIQYLGRIRELRDIEDALNSLKSVRKLVSLGHVWEGEMSVMKCNAIAEMTIQNDVLFDALSRSGFKPEVIPIFLKGLVEYMDNKEQNFPQNTPKF